MLGRESRAAAPNRSEHLELNSGSTRLIPRTTLSPMAMGKRRRRPKQTSMWVATHDLPRTAAHPFYTRLNQILDNAGFDGYVESLCQRFYADEIGRPGLGARPSNRQ